MQTRHFSTPSCPIIAERDASVVQPGQSWRAGTEKQADREASELLKKGTARAAKPLTPGIFIQQQKRKHICHLTALRDGRDVGKPVWCLQAPSLDLHLSLSLFITTSTPDLEAAATFLATGVSALPPPLLSSLTSVQRAAVIKVARPFRMARNRMGGWEPRFNHLFEEEEKK